MRIRMRGAMTGGTANVNLQQHKKTTFNLIDTITNPKVKITITTLVTDYSEKSMLHNRYKLAIPGRLVISIETIICKIETDGTTPHSPVEDILQFF